MRTIFPAHPIIIGEEYNFGKPLQLCPVCHLILKSVTVIIIIIIIIIIITTTTIIWNCKWVFTRWQWYYCNRNKLRGLSPRANYTDRTTGACRRS
jgi:hypothetical protein